MHVTKTVDFLEQWVTSSEWTNQKAKFVTLDLGRRGTGEKETNTRFQDSTVSFILQ